MSLFPSLTVTTLSDRAAVLTDWTCINYALRSSTTHACSHCRLDTAVQLVPQVCTFCPMSPEPESLLRLPYTLLLQQEFSTRAGLHSNAELFGSCRYSSSQSRNTSGRGVASAFFCSIPAINEAQSAANSSMWARSPRSASESSPPVHNRSSNRRTSAILDSD